MDLLGGLSGTSIDSGTTPGAPPGQLYLTSGVFDTILLATFDAGQFAIDNLRIVTDQPLSRHFITFDGPGLVDVPEPVSLMVFGAGLLGAVARRRRRSAAL